MLALCLMLLIAYYANYYAVIIGQSLSACLLKSRQSGKHNVSSTRTFRDYTETLGKVKNHTMCALQYVFTMLIVAITHWLVCTLHCTKLHEP